MGCSPEELRLRYLYRRLIVRGEVRLPLASARVLVGPDCAYHLYAIVAEADGKAEVPDEATHPAGGGHAC
jgi:hypothetical protein